MESENELPLSQKPATCHCTKHCCVTSAKNGEIFCFQDYRNKDWIWNHIRLLIFLRIDRAAAMYSETEVQVFPKQMKQLTTVQNVITEKK